MEGKGQGERGRRRREGREEGREGEGRGGTRREGRGGLSGNVAEEAFCLKSAPAATRCSSSKGTVAERRVHSNHFQHLTTNTTKSGNNNSVSEFQFKRNN